MVMIQNKKDETNVYIHAFLVGLTGFLGAFYFIGCAGIVMFGEERKYPYYMPFGEGMVIVCGITCIAILVRWFMKLRKFEKRCNLILASLLSVIAGLVASIFAYYLIDAAAGLFKWVFGL